ncbi:MAG: hypothetical protein WC146_00795 [Patescibacteria group bacterium]|jgi:cbb3-type cytochrome oxidase subunit 3
MKKKILFISLIFVLFFSLSLTRIVEAAGANEAINGLNQTAQEVGAFQEQTSQDSSYWNNFLPDKIGQIIGIALSFVGVLFFILMIYAGITWMIARGNEQKVAQAKDMIINSVIGIIIVFAAYAITSFIGTRILN